MSYPKFDHLGNVLDRLDTALPHYPYEGEVNEDGFANISFGEQRTVRGVVRPAAAMDFEVGEHGRIDEEELYLLIRNEHGVAEHDRILFDGEQWRPVEQETEYLNDFSLFRLSPDSRGGDTDSDSDSGSDSGDDDTGGFQPVTEDSTPTTDDPTRT